MGDQMDIPGRIGPTVEKHYLEAVWIFHLFPHPISASRNNTSIRNRTLKLLLEKTLFKNM